MVPPLASRFINSFSASAAGNASVAARASASRLACDLRDANIRGRNTANFDWQVTDLLDHAEQEPSVIFSNEVVDETATQMLGPAYTVKEPEDDGRDADAVMQAAEARMMRNPLHELAPVIRNLLRDPAIQRAALANLRQSEIFHNYIAGSGGVQLQAPLQLEWHPEADEGGSGQTGVHNLVEELGSKLMAAGQAALNTAVGMRNALGRLLIHLGANLHALLGQPFSKAPLEEGLTADQLEERAEVVGQALITVAVAILSIVFLKRAHLVTAL